MNTQDNAIVKRAFKRTLCWARNHRLAEEHCRNGDLLFEKQEYAEACARYVDATVFWSSNPVYYTKLAEAYIKCHHFAEAAHAATRALAINPKSIDARYHRGSARAAQGLLKAAKIDFEIVLTEEPTHIPAQSALATTMHDLSLSSIFLPTLCETPLSTSFTPFNTPSTALPLPVQAPTIDFTFPSPSISSKPIYAPSLSDSSDCFHVGNGIPCRFYNTHPSGCALGSECRYSHAPDEKSVRDNLGRNVCTYHLLSICKFGLAKCVYSHCTLYLPDHPGAWWTSREGVEKVKKVVEMAERRGKGRKVGKKEGAEEETPIMGDKPLRKSTGHSSPKSAQRDRVVRGKLSSPLTAPVLKKNAPTPTNRKEFLEWKPPSKKIHEEKPVTRYMRWTEHGLEDLERKETGEVVVQDVLAIGMK